MDELIFSLGRSMSILLELDAPNQDFIIYLDSEHGLRFIFNPTKRVFYVVFVLY